MPTEVPAPTQAADQGRKDACEPASEPSLLPHGEIGVPADENAGDSALEMLAIPSPGSPSGVVSDVDAPTSDNPAFTTAPSVLVPDQDRILVDNVELWPATAGVSLAGLPKGWERRLDIHGRRYYVDHRTMATTWHRPPGALETPRDSTVSDAASPIRVVAAKQYSTAQKQYVARVQAGLVNDIDEGMQRGMTRCRINSTGMPTRDISLLETMLFLQYQQQTNHDMICVIEDISEPWIAELGVFLDLPVTFLRKHLEWSPDQSLAQSLTQELFESIEDSLERLLRFIQAMDDVAQPALLSLLDKLAASLASSRDAVSIWADYGSDGERRELEATCRANIKILDSITGSLRDTSVLSPSDKAARILDLIRDIDSTLDVFKARRSEAWYCLRVTVSDDASSNKIYDRSGTQIGHWRHSHLSYFRVTKSLLGVIILVDRPWCVLHNNTGAEPQFIPPSSLPEGTRLGNYHCRVVEKIQNDMGRYPLLPADSQHNSPGLYESLGRFLDQGETWRTGILFAQEEHESTSRSDEPNVHREDQPARDSDQEHAPRYVTLAPHAFMYLLSSYLLGRNLLHLERKTRSISFQDPRELAARDTGSINNDLTSFRKDLDFLTREVADAIAWAPVYLEAYYNTFPQIRWANPASHRSPLDQLASILVRAKGLEKLLIDSFQMLQAAVSVQQATLSNEQAAITTKLAADTAKQASASAEQATAATRITALAFVYIPLTFVTGIFGMNIRIGAEEPKGFIWYAPLVTLGAAIVFTVALWYAADWIDTRLAARREKRKMDIEDGQSISKAKSE